MTTALLLIAGQAVVVILAGCVVRVLRQFLTRYEHDIAKREFEGQRQAMILDTYIQLHQEQVELANDLKRLKERT